MTRGLDIVAQRDGVSRSDAIRRLIEAGLRAEAAPAPKAAGRKKA
jgi:hypothetical protein